ncbi:MAG: T9SS type A sorting domain-containing protein [Bacteroidetes bacterium]|nr:T9SS type A sorting domain-containing protein [Bacteroidota bacterium]
MKRIITLAILLPMMHFSVAQIPNNGFENWTSMGTYSNPDNWSCMNTMTVSSGIFTCLKGTPGNPGTSYLKMVSKNISGLGLVPGLAMCGPMNQSTLQPTSGFPYSQRPAAFSGNWQYMAYGTDQGYISISLTKWNTATLSHDVIAFAYYPLPGMVMSWGALNIPLTYMSPNNPDSCMLILSASNANGATTAANSYLYLDDLHFSGSAIGINENNSIEQFSIYPNPVKEFLYFDLSFLKNEKATVEIYNLVGKQIKTINNIRKNTELKISVDDFPKGIYLLKLLTPAGVSCKRFIRD